jgi:hypothetical protein
MDPHPKRIKRAPQNADIIIPRDTLGNVMPFPVPSGRICRLKPDEWEGMWIREALGTLPREADCSVCGDYFQSKEIFPLDRGLMHPTIQRQVLNTTLQATRICIACKAHCSECRKIIPRAQKKRTDNMCQPCADDAKAGTKHRRR